MTSICFRLGRRGPFPRIGDTGNLRLCSSISKDCQAERVICAKLGEVQYIGN